MKVVRDFLLPPLLLNRGRDTLSWVWVLGFIRTWDPKHAMFLFQLSYLNIFFISLSSCILKVSFSPFIYSFLLPEGFIIPIPRTLLAPLPNVSIYILYTHLSLFKFSTYQHSLPETFILSYIFFSKVGWSEQCNTIIVLLLIWFSLNSFWWRNYNHVQYSSRDLTAAL